MRHRLFFATALASVAIWGHATHIFHTDGSYFVVDVLGPAGGPLQFGSSSAMSGDVAIIEAPKNTSVSSGYASIYRKVDAHWQLEASLPNDQNLHDYTSHQGCGGLAIDNDVAVVGTPDVNAGQGAAIVYRRGSKGWEQEQVLLDAGGGAGEHFGCSIGIANGMVVVGAPGYKGVGAGFVYEYSSAWNLSQMLVPGAAEVGDTVGYSVAVSDDEVVLGAPHGHSGLGNAWVFSRSSLTSWSVRELRADDGAVGDLFGVSVSVSHGWVAIGAPGNSSNAGAAYVYPPTLVPAGKVAIPGAPSGTYLGAAVAIDGDRLIVSELGDDAADMYRRDKGSWRIVGTAQGGDGTCLGGSLSLSGPTALIGAYADSGGKAYFLEDDWIFSNGNE